MRFPKAASVDQVDEEDAALAEETALLQPLADRVYDAVSDCMRAPTEAQTHWIVAETIAQMRFMLRDGEHVTIPGIGILLNTGPGQRIGILQRKDAQ